MPDDDPHRVLARNAACHQCRRRKLKCDAQRPTCGNCLKPRQRGPIKYEPPEPCTWDEQRDPSARTLRKRETKAAQRAGAFAATVDINDDDTCCGDDGGHVTGKRARGEDGEPHTLTMGQPVPIHMSMAQCNALEWAEAVPIVPPRPLNGSPGVPRPPPLQNGSRASVSGSSDSQNWELSWPDWPVDLPTLEVVEHMVNMFFERVPTLPRMIHKGQFLATLQLPPSHPKFPATVLLHGILAVTAPYLSPATLSSPAYFPTGAGAGCTEHPEYDFEPRAVPNPQLATFSGGSMDMTGTPLGRFQLWHRRKCFEGLGHHINLGVQLLQASQAMVTGVWVDILNAWWTDLWVESSSAVRLAIPLNIHLSSVKIHNSLLRNPKELLEPASTAIEQAERDRTWWMIYCTERTAISGTAWPSCIVDEEITTELPVLQSVFENTGPAGPTALKGCQTLHSPELYTNHPPQHCDSFSFLVKSIKLFTDTNEFIRHYSRGEHSYARYLADPRLRKCLDDINQFRISYPESMRRPIMRTPDGGETVDGDLFTCLTLTHAAVLNLGEPLITHQTWSDDAAKMTLSAVRAILSLIYDVTSTSYDLTLLPATNSFHWCLAARCLLRFIAAARVSNDPVSVSVFEAELKVFLLVMTQFGERHPVGQRHVKLVEMLKEASSMQTGNFMSMTCTKDQVFDQEYGNQAPRKATRSGSPVTTPELSSSSMSPNTAFSGVTPSASGAPIHPSGPTANGYMSGPLAGTNNPHVNPIVMAGAPPLQRHSPMGMTGAAPGHPPPQGLPNGPNGTPVFQADGRPYLGQGEGSMLGAAPLEVNGALHGYRPPPPPPHAPPPSHAHPVPVAQVATASDFAVPAAIPQPPHAVPLVHTQPTAGLAQQVGMMLPAEADPNAPHDPGITRGLADHHLQRMNSAFRMAQPGAGGAGAGGAAGGAVMGAGGELPPPELPPMPWLKNVDGFDIHSFAFDVEAMAQYVAAVDPNATFDGNDLFMRG